MHTRSEQINELAAALAAAQAQFGSVLKDKTAKVEKKTGGSYEYRYSNLSSALDAVLPALNAEGLALLQPTTNRDECIEIETLLLHKATGQWISSTTTMPLPVRALTNQQGEVIGMSRPTPQEIGSAITYGRRYALMAMLGFAAEDDDGAEATKGMAEDRGRPVRREARADVEREGVLRVWRQEISEAAERGEAALAAVGKRISQQTDWIKQETRADFRAALARAKAVEAEREVEAERAGTNA